MSGADLQRPAQIARAAARAPCRKATASRRAAIAVGSRSGSPAGAASSARTRPRQPCGRWRRAGCPARSPDSERNSSRLASRRGVDQRAGHRARSGAARAGRDLLPICVSSTYFRRRADGRQLRRENGAERRQIGDGQPFLQQSARRPCCRRRRPPPASRRAGDADPVCGDIRKRPASGRWRSPR
mgnify:CR=1 FL=1